MRLIITRHGETEENIAGIIQGHLPGKLSKQGIEQAKKLALRLKNEKIDCIYSSDLARAADTAREIAKFHPDAPITFVKELRERNLGEFQGKKKSDLGWDNKQLMITYLEPKDGETMKQLYNRASKFLHKILKEHLNETILFVGHNGINKAMAAVVMGKSAEEINTINNFKNTSISIFELDENKNHKIHLMNCTAHLS